MSRRYDPLRDAHTPRTWVAIACVLPATLLMTQVVVAVIDPLVVALPVVFAMSLAIGCATVRVQWWLWRRRHPAQPERIVALGALLIEEHVRHVRDTARWN